MRYPNHERSDDAFHDSGIDRRTVLKMTGSAVVAATAAAGTASAHPPDEIRFCGCSQVCVDRSNPSSAFRVIYATDVGGDFECTTPGEDEKIRTDRCVEAGSGRKIVGVIGGGGQTFANPNHCARMALERSTDADCPDPDDAVDCTQVDKHEYVCAGVTIRTRKCKPPEKWGNDDGHDGNGRGNANGNGKGRGNGNRLNWSGGGPAR